MSKGFTIKIIDNETGKALVDYTDAKAIIGGIQIGDMSHSIGFVRGSPVDAAYAIAAAQKSIVNQIEEHPQVEVICQMIANLENCGGEDDDE